MGQQAKVVMYGTAMCPYCAAARMLLTKKKVAFEDISVTGNSELRAEMEQRSGRRTVPQIFIDDEAVGGFDDIYALDQQGKLDGMLGLTG
jgi:glutaredoxin 3